MRNRRERQRRKRRTELVPLTRDPQDESGALAGLAPGLDIAAVGRGDLAGYAQAQPRTTFGAGRVRPVEPLEHAEEIVHRYTAALLSEVLEAQQRGRLDPLVPAHYLRKLLAALEQGAPSATPQGTELPKPLSEREPEVLSLIAAGRSNRRIARELFVAQSTVKTHVKNINRKLDTHSRTQAVSRARKLNLL